MTKTFDAWPTQRLSLDDFEIDCVITRGAGRPLVLLHGFSGHRDDFRARLPELAEMAPLVIPDLRGHGDASVTRELERLSFEGLVSDLLRLLDRLEIEKCDLLGHSFGGMVALRFVLAHPERVESLVLMDTAPFAPARYTADTFRKAGAIAESRGMVFLQELVEKGARADPDPSPSDQQAAKWADQYWSHHRRRYAAMQPEAYGRLGIAMAEQESLVPRLSEIRCPTSVIVGADDSEFLAGADALSQGIAGARRATIPDAGHHPQMENPTGWLEALRGARSIR